MRRKDYEDALSAVVAVAGLTENDDAAWTIRRAWLALLTVPDRIDGIRDTLEDMRASFASAPWWRKPSKWEWHQLNNLARQLDNLERSVTDPLKKIDLEAIRLLVAEDNETEQK